PEHYSLCLLWLILNSSEFHIQVSAAALIVGTLMPFNRRDSHGCRCALVVGRSRRFRRTRSLASLSTTLRARRDRSTDLRSRLSITAADCRGRLCSGRGDVHPPARVIGTFWRGVPNPDGIGPGVDQRDGPTRYRVIVFGARRRRD